MNFFDLIEDNHVILNMCKEWDTATLLNMSETHKRIGDVCREEIKKRKEDYIKSILPDLDLINFFLFILPYNEYGQMSMEYEDISEKVVENFNNLDLKILRKYSPDLKEDLDSVTIEIYNLLTDIIEIKKSFWITDGQNIEFETVEQRLIIKRGKRSMEGLLSRILVLDDNRAPSSVKFKGFIEKLPAIEVKYKDED